MDSKGSRKTRIHTSISRITVFGITACTILLIGCAREFNGKATEQQIHVSDIQKVETIKLTEDVLAQLHFTIDKVDVQSGLIKTKPLAGAQFFEFWRGDNIGANNSLLANLHTIRRAVEVNIAQQGKKVRIGCHVRIQRLSLPEREITSSTRAYDMFSRSSPSLQKFELNPEQEKAMTWIDLGEDIPLANEILKRIREKILDHRINRKRKAGNTT